MDAQKLFPNLGLKLEKRDLINDVLAGVVLALLLIPQSMSYALLAGLPPIYGLYASTLPVLLAAVGGSSRYMQTGPVAMVSFMTLIALGGEYGRGSADFIAHAHLLALVVGAELLILAAVIKAFKITYVLNLISHDIILGFTNAGAIIIIVSQLGHLFGVKIAHHDVVLGTVSELAGKITSLNPYTLGIGVLTISIMLLGRRIHRLFPGALVSIIASALIVKELRLSVEVVGELPQGLPHLYLPSMNFSSFSEMLLPSAMIIIVGLMEALAIGRYLAKVSKERYDPTQELLGQGVSNLAAGFLSAYPVFGSFSRSSLNYFVLRGKSAVVAATSALLVLVALFFTSLFHYVPLASLAGVIIVALAPLIKPKDLVRLYYSNKSDGTVALTVFFLAFVTRIDTALLLGIAMSLILFFMESVKPRVHEVRREAGTRTFAEAGEEACPQITLVGIDNDIYFANAGEVFSVVKELLNKKPLTRVVIITGESINYIDVQGEDAFLEFVEELRRKDMEVILVEFKERILKQLYMREMVKKIGKERVLSHKSEAISRAMKFIEVSRCSECKGVFKECDKVQGGD